MYIYHFFNDFQSIEISYLKRKKLIFLVLHPVLGIKEIPSKMPHLENCVPDLFSHRIHNKQWKTPNILVFLLDYYKGTISKGFMQWCMVARTCEPSTLESFKSVTMPGQGYTKKWFNLFLSMCFKQGKEKLVVSM